MSKSNEENQNMAEAAAARREARRRRILENSHNRLQLISGKSGDECTVVNAVAETPVSAVLNTREIVDVPPASTSCCSLSSVLNGTVFTEHDILGLLSANHTSDASGDNELTNDLTTLLSSSTTEVAPMPTTWENLVTYKYDILLVSLSIQILYSLFAISMDGAYFFLPLIIYIALKLKLFPPQDQSKLGSLLMLMNGMSHEKVQNILFVAQLVLTFCQDVCIFLFCTICIQALSCLIRDLLTT